MVGREGLNVFFCFFPFLELHILSHSLFFFYSKVFNILLEQMLLIFVTFFFLSLSLWISCFCSVKAVYLCFTVVQCQCFILMLPEVQMA